MLASAEQVAVFVNDIEPHVKTILIVFQNSHLSEATLAHLRAAIHSRTLHLRRNNILAIAPQLPHQGEPSNIVNENRVAPEVRIGDIREQSWYPRNLKFPNHYVLIDKKGAIQGAERWPE